MKNKGFTLIELIVVIAIIAVVSGIIFVSTSVARDQAKIIKITNDMKNIVIALSYELKNQGRSTWWTESELGLGNNPQIGLIVGANNPLKKIPSPNIRDASKYLYDNDGDVLGSNEAVDKGINILISFNNDATRDKYFDMLDDKFEYGNGEARGRIRKAPGSIMFFNIFTNE